MKIWHKISTKILLISQIFVEKIDTNNVMRLNVNEIKNMSTKSYAHFPQSCPQPNSPVIAMHRAEITKKLQTLYRDSCVLLITETVDITAGYKKFTKLWRIMLTSGKVLCESLFSQKNNSENFHDFRCYFLLNLTKFL